jgi:hypothetical protein
MDIDKEIKTIEKLAMKILQEEYSQKCGTEYQKWTYAIIKATKIIENERYKERNEKD